MLTSAQWCTDVITHGCRPTDDSNQPPGRGVLSMHGLTYGVIRVDSEEKLSVLTVQDVGLVMPGGKELSLKLTMIHQFN